MSGEGGIGSAGRVVVLGGGLSGLSAAWKLARAGCRNITVVEREEDVGGLARTIVTETGARYDLGSHRIHVQFLPEPMAVLPSSSRSIRAWRTFSSGTVSSKRQCTSANSRRTAFRDGCESLTIRSVERSLERERITSPLSAVTGCSHAVFSPTGAFDRIIGINRLAHKCRSGTANAIPESMLMFRRSCLIWVAGG